MLFQMLIEVNADVRKQNSIQLGVPILCIVEYELNSCKIAELCEYFYKDFNLQLMTTYILDSKSEYFANILLGFQV